MGKWALRIFSYLVLLFILSPVITIFVSSLNNANFISFPPQNITFKWYVEVFQNSNLIQSLGTSIYIGIVTAILSIILALSVSLALEKNNFPGKNIINSLLFAPITLPMVVLGIGLLFFLTSIGLVRTNTGLILSHTVVALPYAMRSLASSIKGIDADVERSAAILGAKPFKILYKVTVPMILPGVIAGGMFSFLISFNNITLSIFLVGPKTNTFPVVLYHLTENVLSPIIAAAATISIALSAIIVIILEKRFSVYSML